MKLSSMTALKCALSLSVVVLVGCEQKPATETTNNATTVSPSTSASAAQATANTPSAGVTMADNYVSPLPATAPTYKVLTTGSMAPFSFSDDKGGLMGYDVDAIRAIGEAGGFKVEFYKVPFKDIFKNIEAGKYDLAVSAISYTDERKNLFNVSDSYFFNPSAMMYVNSAKPLKTLADLKELRVAAVTGSKQLEQVKIATGATEFGTYDTTYLLFQALVQGKYDAIVQDEPFLRYSAKNFPEQKVTIVPYEAQNEPTAQQIVLMKKGSDELTAKVNKGIAETKSNGKLKQLEAKWFGK